MGRRIEIGRRGFLKLSSLTAAGLALDPELLAALERSRRVEMGPLAAGADLDLTQFWDDGVYMLTPDLGRVRVAASLFIEKGGKWNYDQDLKPGSSKYVILPDPGETQLQWNSHEAIFNWGTRILRPGEEIAFTENIDPFDQLTPDEYGEKGKHGDGYINFSNGICNASTTLADAAFGIEIEIDGVFVPLFIARPGSIQPHNYEHNPDYYEYAYNGFGVGVSPPNERGHLPFMVNPNLPSSVVVALGMEARDTRPGKKRMGIYKPTATVEIQGLPRGSRVRFQRMTASREARERIVRRVIGARDYIMPEAPSKYFYSDGTPIISDRPIPPEPFNPESVIPVTTMMETIMRSYLRSSRVPDSVFQEGMFPGGVARPATRLGIDSVYWERSDILLPVASDDLPAPMRGMSRDELIRIFNWNNVDRKGNMRYEKGSGMVAVRDWAQAYRFKGYPIGAPVPGWMTIREQVITASIFHDWLVIDPAATLLGWWAVRNAEEAQRLANAGYFVPAVVRSRRSVGLSPIAMVAPGEGKLDKNGNFWPNAVDGVYRFGPKNGKTVRDCMGYAINNGDYFSPAYFAWVPPEL